MDLTTMGSTTLAALEDSASNRTLTYYVAPDWVYYCSAMALFVIGVLGISSNLLTVLTFIKDKELWTPFNLLLLNLVLIELTSASVGLPINFVSSLNKGWFLGGFMCSVTATAMAFAGIGSLSMLCLLAVHRCMVIVFPHRAAHINSRSGAVVLLVVSWVYTAAVVLPPNLGWGYFREECIGISCGPAWNDPANWSYTLYLLFTGFCIPASVIAVSTIIVVLTMKKHTASMQPGAIQTSMAKRERRVTKMVLTMLVAFFTVWTPYAVCAMLVLAGYSDLLESAAAVVPVIMAKTSTFITPLIYIIMNKEFQRSFKRSMCFDGCLPPEEPSQTTQTIQMRTKTVTMGSSSKEENSATIL